MNAKIIDKAWLTADTLLFSFEAPGFTFEAGQFIAIHIKKSESDVKRFFSILNPPSKLNQIDLCIRMVSGGATILLEDAHIGEEYQIDGPYGKFVLDANAKKHVFLATGTGIVPFHSMLLHHLTKKHDHTFVLYFGARTKEDLVFNDVFESLAEVNEHFTYHPILSRQEWNGKKGHVQDHILPELKQVEETMFYICGLKDFVLQTEQLLLDNHIPKNHIRKEVY